MKKNFNKLLVVSLLLILSSQTSCLLRPKFTPPCVDTPEEWRFSSNSESATLNMRWWEQFQDPVLNDLVKMAIANNNDLQVAIARVDEYYGRLGVVRSELYPQIDGNASAYRTQLSLKTSPPMLPEFRTFNNYSLLFNTFYEIDIWGRIHSATDAALADLFAQIEFQRTVVITLVSNTASSYIQLRQFDKQLEIGVLTYESRMKSFALAKLRYEGGLTSEMEVKQAESEVQSALVQIKEAERLIAQQENQLSVLLGINPTSIPRGLTLTELTLPPRVPAGLPSDLLEQRPDILQAEDNLMATVSRVGEAKAAFFPRISLTGFFGFQSTELHDFISSPSQTWQYGLSLFQPIFEGGRLISRLDIAKAINREALYTYFQTILIAFKEVDDALIAHQKSLELIVIEQKQVDVLREYLSLATMQYDNGQTDYLNVLDAERNLFRAQLLLVSFQSDSFLSLIELYKALGGGWDEELMNSCDIPPRGVSFCNINDE